MIDIISDFNTLTTIPISNLEQLANKVAWIICDGVNEANLSNNSTVDIDLYIGKLSICFDNESVKYRFTPSKTLDANVKTTLLEGKSPLEKVIEDKLATKIVNTYKDLF